MTIDLFTLYLAAIALLSLGYITGHLHGREKGKALGWQEGYFGRVRDDQKRRDHFGRFKAKNAPRHTL